MEALKSTGTTPENEQLFAKHCAMLATRAALYEVVAAPKPGLVDRLDRGAHKDMDLFTFIDSATALTPYFETFFRLGYTEKTGCEHLFSQLRKAGQEAEKAMFSATQGINTHKGLIFLMAIFCGSLGYQWAKSEPIISQATLRRCCAALGQFSLADFKTPDMTGTAGGICYERHGVVGIRRSEERRVGKEC